MWNCGNWGAGLPFNLGKYFMGFGPFGGLLSLLLFILLLYVVIKIIMSLKPKPNVIPDRQDSLGILKNRLRKGEITQEEYHRMREILMS